MKQLLVTGANRGIGLEFTQQYLANGWHVYATYREQPGTALASLACDQLTILPLDVAEDASTPPTARTVKWCQFRFNHQQRRLIWAKGPIAGKSLSPAVVRRIKCE